MNLGIVNVISPPVNLRTLVSRGLNNYCKWYNDFRKPLSTPVTSLWVSEVMFCYFLPWTVILRYSEHHSLNSKHENSPLAGSILQALQGKLRGWCPGIWSGSSLLPLVKSVISPPPAQGRTLEHVFRVQLNVIFSVLCLLRPSLVFACTTSLLESNIKLIFRISLPYSTGRGGRSSVLHRSPVQICSEHHLHTATFPPHWSQEVPQR